MMRGRVWWNVLDTIQGNADETKHAFTPSARNTRAHARYTLQWILKRLRSQLQTIQDIVSDVIECPVYVTLHKFEGIYHGVGTAVALTFVSGLSMASKAT